MRSFLRQTGRIAPRSSSLSAGVRSASRPRTTPTASVYAVGAPQSVRRYASVNPEPPKEPKDEKEQESQTPQGETKNASAQHQSTGGLRPGYTKLSADEERALDEMFTKLRKSMPMGQSKEMDKALEALKQQGIPQELREIMQQVAKNGASSLNLSTAAKLIRMTTSLARKAADQAVYGEEAKDKQEQDNKSLFKKEIDTNEPQSQREQPQAKTGKDDPGPQKTNPDPQKNKKNPEKGEGWREIELKFDLNTFLLSAFLAYMTYRLIMPGENSREITWQEFRTTFLDKGLVEKISVINGSRARVYLHRESVAAMYPESPAAHGNFHYYFTLGSIESFERRLDEAQKELQIPSSERIPVAYEHDVPWLATILSFGPTLLLIGGIFFLSRRAAGGGGGQSGIFGMGKSRAKKFNHETAVKVKFADVAGMDEAKQEIMEFVSFLKEPSVYQKLGAKIPRGAILSGPPGTGKTLLAKATAGESGTPFFSVSGSEFVEMFVGVGPSRVRDLFATARKNAPCIIFIDEIDAIGKSRAKQNFGGGNDERESTLNQILTEMDGFNTSEQVVVIAGTNRVDILDKALLRPGRFDRHISVDKPTMDGRKQIFAVHLKHIVTKEDIEHLKGRLAALTPGFSGADIANCVNEAALVAARYHADSVTLQHFEQAIERVIGGLEKKSLVLSPEEKKTVAYHEAGHAICGWYFKWADPLLKVSIIPRGQGALGYAQYLPAGDTYLLNVNQLMDRMAMTLGGRVSEELHFDTVTSGASDDFQKVTRLAQAMVTRFGMSKKIGFLSYEDDTQQQMHKPFSEETAKNIDSEVRRIVDEAYKQCKDLLTEKKAEVGIVAEELLRKEMLTRDDMVRLLGPRPFEEKEEFAKYFGGGPRDVEGNNPGMPKPPTLGSIESDSKSPPNVPNQGGEGLAPTTFERDNLRWPQDRARR